MLGVLSRDDCWFLSDKGPKKRYPINTPIVIGSDRIGSAKRIAKNPDSGTINDMRGVNTEMQVMVLPTEHACYFASGA